MVSPEPLWVAPPYGEPPAKAFKEWNTAWNPQHNDNEDSWAVTEPAIYYHAAYNLLLSPFVGTKAESAIRPSSGTSTR